MTKRKTPKRGLFWTKENESNNRSLLNNEWKCFIGKNHRRLLQSYDESLEEDLVSNEGSTRDEISKVGKSCREKNDERKLGNEKSAINRDEEQRDNIDEDSKENFEGNVNEENDERDNLKAGRYVRTLERAKNPYDARVNMMIKQRIAQKHREDEKNHVRRKRYPLGIIEYYDYDEEINERSRESQAIDDNEQKSDDKKESLFGSSLGLDDNLRESQNDTLMKKKNEQAEEQEKEKKRKEQMKNKEPKQQFLFEQVPAKNENPSKFLRSKVALEDEREEDNSLQMNREKSFLNEAAASGEFRNEKSSGRGCRTKWSNKRKKQDEYNRVMEEPNQEFVSVERVVPKESLEYIFQGPETLQREIVDVVFGDVQPIEFPERKKKLDSFGKTRLGSRLAMKKLDEKEYDDIDNVLYEELKKLYDWEDNENKNGPRLKGDQRMHQESDDDLENKTNDSNNNTSASNYMALKKTDDLFKGGVEQGDIFEERTSNGTKNHQSNPNYSNIGNIEWKVIPVVETINDSRSKSSGVLRSGLSKRKTAPETDSGSPYENGKYHDSMNELEENVPSIDGDKRSLLESKDMHESFVEPMDRIDDFDDDIKVRLGRGLKTINDDSIKNDTSNDTSTNVPSINNENLTTTMNIVKMSTNYEINTINSSYYPRDINDNSNETIKKNEKKSRSSNESHSTVNSVKIESSSRPRLEPLANRNASRVKREGNSYSLNYDEGNPYDTYYSHSNDITKDLYTIDPYKYKENDNTHLKYSDLNDLYKSNEDDSNGRKINDRKKNKNKRRRNKKKKRKRKKNKNKKRKRNKKKNKKNSKWKMTKKRARNLNKDERFEFLGDSKRRRKLSKRRPFANFREIVWRKGQQRQRKKKNMGAKKRKEVEKIEMKKYRETGTAKGIRRNSNADIVAGSNVIQQESVNDQNTMREKETEDEDTRRKKLAMLLTADNMEDESQMDLALHGELAGKIVENIFEQVQKNEALKVALGPGLYRKNKPEDSTENDKTYQGFDDGEIKHTEKTMKKVMELLGRLVLDEVQKKTCSALPPDMRQFLEWMLEVNGKKESEEQTPLLPLVHDKETTEHPSDDKILFPKTSDQEPDKDVNELHKKVRILQNLINQYNALSAKEKIKVQTVHDYLVRQLNLLLHYIEMKEKSEKNKTGPKTVPSRRNAEFILRYDNASPNVEFDRNLTSSKDANVSDFWKFDNVTYASDVERKKRRPIRSSNYSVNKKRRKKRKKRKRKRRRRNERRYDKNETPEYRKLARHAAMIRQKRGDNLEDEWDQFDFKYEQPEIYKSMSILNDQNGKIRDGRSTDLKKKREIRKRDNVTIANLYNDNFDDLPVKGKNLAEDEMILLNKRESWKKQNERQLEEVAFGKDMRNKLREEEQFERLTGIKGKKIVNDEKPREKRENNKIEKIEEGKKTFIRSTLNNVTLNINTTVVSYYELTTVHSSPNFVNDKIISLKKPNDTSENEEKLKMMERGINVYADDKNETSRTTEKKKKKKN
uniref:MATH and LRR domain-containing protein PFE0570w-like isoform X2 n=1 Tax=Vespula vulgaris TaxID=7454 RepID=UPI00223B12FE|nr:MATH and LRR domain-containing protein PFE0570w-like isoform X2 [Vespula vulgaris]